MAQDDMRLCALQVNGHKFGIAASSIREVLGAVRVQRIPLAPAFVAGMVSHRGDVLTAVSLRGLLKLPVRNGQGCVMVLGGAQNEQGNVEPFVLVVDAVPTFVTVRQSERSEAPGQFSDASRRLSCGIFRVKADWLMLLDAKRLNLCEKRNERFPHRRGGPACEY